MVPLRVAIIGFGKIAEDQHVPSIRGNARYAFAAAASPRIGEIEGVATYRDHREMLQREQLDAVAICTPPAIRYEIARDCIAAGKHVLLEKPPGVTLGEVEVLRRIAVAHGVTLFTTWHAQYNPAVAAAADLLAGKRIAAMEIVWKEDVRKWHPGQQWIWRAGGFGVFDPGINALSIATHIFPGELVLRSASLSIPENCQAPIAADLIFTSPVADAELSALFDWRHSGEEAWDIRVLTAEGVQILLSRGGSALAVDGVERDGEGPSEYAAIYQRFLDLVDRRVSLVDVEPLRLTADAFLAGSRTSVEAFHD